MTRTVNTGKSPKTNSILLRFESCPPRRRRLQCRIDISISVYNRTETVTVIWSRKNESRFYRIIFEQTILCRSAHTTFRNVLCTRDNVQELSVEFNVGKNKSKLTIAEGFFLVRRYTAGERPFK